MNRLIKNIGIVGIAFAWQMAVFGQGKINFESQIKIIHEADSQPVSSDGYLAQLYYGTAPDPHSMSPVGSVVTVRGGKLSSPSPNLRSLPGTSPGAGVFVQLRVWNSLDNFSFESVRDSGGNIGVSNVIQVTLQDNPSGMLDFPNDIIIKEVAGNHSGGGLLRFSNKAPGVNAPILSREGIPIEGDNYIAQIYAGPEPLFLNPVKGTRVFGTGENAGYFSGENEWVTAQLVHPGQQTYVKVYVWERRGGFNYESAVEAGVEFGESNIFSVVAGGGYFPSFDTPSLVGLESFQLKRLDPIPRLGSILFANQYYDEDLGERITMPITGPDGNALEGQKYKAQLYAGKDPFNLVKVGWPQDFFNGARGGQWAPATRLIPNSEQGEEFFVRVRVWDSTEANSADDAFERHTTRGESNIIRIKTGGHGTPPALPAPLKGMEGFKLFRGISPAIIQDLTPIFVVEGDPIELNFTVDASAPYVVEWFKDEQSIGIVGSTSYVINQSTQQHNGTYYAIVTNEAGSLRTQSISVSVSQKIVAPIISSVNGERTIKLGDSLRLNVEFSGTQPANVHWIKDGETILSNSSNTLVIDNISSDFEGNYSVRVSNSAGADQKQFGQVTVYQPLSWVSLPKSGAFPEDAQMILQASASGTGPISYTWLLNGNVINSSGRNNLILENPKSNQSGQYQVKAEHPFGAIQSEVFTIEFLEPPTITLQPEDIKVAVGERVQLKSNASGSAPLYYQWFKDGIRIPGKTSPTLFVPSASESDEGNYHVEVTNDVGEIKSSIASITAGAKPEIQHIASSVTTHLNHSALIWAEVSGDDDISYEWLLDGTVLKTSDTPWVIIDDLSDQNIGAFQVKATNEFGSITSDMIPAKMVNDLDFDYPAQPSITRLLPAGISEDKKLDVLMAISGFNGEKVFIIERVPEGVEVESVSDGGEYNSKSKTIIWNLPTSGSFLVSYSAIVESEYSPELNFEGESLVENQILETDRTVIKGNDYKSIHWVEIPEPNTYAAGEKFALTAGASGHGEIEYSWYFNGNVIEGQNQNTLVMQSGSVEQSGIYRVEAQDLFDNISSPDIQIEVLIPPTITSQPSDVKIVRGNAFQIGITASGSGPLEFQWFKNGVELPGQTSSILKKQESSFDDDGSYTIRVSNAVGFTKSNPAIIKTGLKPEIQLVSTPVTTHIGLPALLWAKVIGDTPIKYEWKWDGASISNKEEPWLIVNGISGDKGGQFQLIVQNEFGSTSSDIISTKRVEGIQFEFPENPTVTRLMPHQVKSKESIDVYLALGGLQNEGVYIVERLPDNVAVESVNDGGWYDSKSNSITWDLPHSDNILLSYSISISGEPIEIPEIVGESLWNNQLINTNEIIRKDENFKTLDWVKLPEPQLIPTLSSLELTAEAVGTEPITYSWLFNGQTIEGAISNSLNISSIASGQSGNYQVIAQDAFGKIISPEIRVDVLAAPTIAEQPESIKVAEGDSYKLEVMAIGEGQLKYQWFKNGSALLGATQSIISNNSASPTDQGVYTVQISNEVGSITSMPANLTTGLKPDIQLISNPATHFSGHSILLWVQALGDSPMRYIWKWNGNTISTTDVPWLYQSQISNDRAGQFQLTVENDFGASSPKTISLKPVEDIQFEFPENPSVTRLLPASIEASSTCDVILALAGLRNKKIFITERLPANAAIESINDGGWYDEKSHSINWNLPSSGEIFLSYTISVPAELSSPLVFNGESIWNDQLLTTEETLKKDSDYKPLQWAHIPQDQRVEIDTQAVLVAEASGTGPISYRWTFNGAPIDQKTSNKLTIPRVTDELAGIYQVTAENPYGSLTSPDILIDVLEPPTISLQPESVKIAAGDTLKLAVLAQGSLPLNYQWIKNGIPIAGKVSETLTIENTTLEDAGEYKVTIRNEVGEVTSASVLVSAGQKPEIIFLSSPVTTHVGHSALLWAQVSGDTPMQYEWKWEGTKIGTSNKPFIILDSISDEELGTFQLTVHNSLGSTTSEPITAKRVDNLGFSYPGTPSVTRILPDYVPQNKNLDVYLALSGMSGEKIFTIERLPKNLTITSVRDGGRYDPTSHTITWNLPTSDTFLLSYSGRVANSDSNTFEFNGESIWGDEILPTTGAEIIGDGPTISADNAPKDYKITFNEANDFVSAYLNDEQWDNGRIPLSYAVRILTILNSGGNYRVDPSKEVPLSWSPDQNIDPRDLQQTSGPLNSKPNIYFVGQATRDQSLQIVVDLPERQAKASGIELSLNPGWSWEKDGTMQTAKWIFPDADTRHLVIDVFPKVGSFPEELKVSGLFSVDGKLESFNASTSVDSPLPSSITSAKIENNKIVLSGATELTGKWVIESTIDFIVWRRWKEFENTTTAFEVSGEIENVHQKFFRVRFISQ